MRTARISSRTSFEYRPLSSNRRRWSSSMARLRSIRGATSASTKRNTPSRVAITSAGRSTAMLVMRTSRRFLRLLLPERLAQLALEDFAGAGERQRLVAHVDAARAFVVRDSLLAECDHLGGIDRDAGLAHNDRMHSLAPAL